MRLTAIRLAGFKSFVDPTTLALASNLTGVVGPNGCGKSNVIDAVRWVTGESSARQLRGEALEDVIFNGSKARKPVGRASVELKFDNSAGKLGGQYGAFGEISIKRELARDGGSRYFINGAKARRRDVIDLFLGTGLGGRSNYAVIEQGAVNRLIEAKPDDMRQVLEEAAGISKYKERRRETENRIRHTRENLDRLNDLIGEVSQRLGTLKRQAANAEKYKQFKADERRLRAELLALRWAAQNREVEAAEQRLREGETALGDAVSAQREAVADRDRQSAAQQRAMTAVQDQQAAYYDAQARAGRIEQQLAHARELSALRGRERGDLAERIAALDARIAEDQAADAAAADEISNTEKERQSAANALGETRSAQTSADTAASNAEQAWDAHNRAEQNPVQQLDAERTRARYADERLAQLGKRRDIRAGEREQLGDVDDSALMVADEEIERRAGQLQRDEQAARDSAEADDALRDKIAQAEPALADLRTRLGENQARLASEKTLQQAVLREDDAGVGDWLKTHGLGGAAGVARQVRVASEWQTAAEAALGSWLRGLLVDNLPHGAGGWPAERLTLIEQRTDDAEHDIRTAPAAPEGAVCLADGIEAPALIRALAERVFVVDDLSQALSLRDQLGVDQRLVTLDGCCVGAASLVTPAVEAAEKGVLEREARINALAVDIEADQARFERNEIELEKLNARRRESREQRQRLDQQIAQQQRELEAARAEQQGRRMRAEQIKQRRDEINAELAELAQQIDAAEAEKTRLAADVQALIAAADDFNAARHAAQANLATARKARDSARRQSATAEQGLRAIDDRLTQLANRRESIGTRLTDSQTTRAELAERLAVFDAAGNDNEAAVPDVVERDAAIEVRAAAERELRAARETLKACEKALEGSAQALMQVEQRVDGARETLQQAKIEVETANVRRAGVAEQLDELNESPQAIIERLPADSDAARASEEIETIERRIQRLGAINLAAIEEYDAEAEREDYLQSQHADLSEALATLDAAIAKIDRETRSRFKATFEQANARFGQMFPELFGGGEAALELTEDDWLATGVRVMARPPGKRNASIQMLSGGEKALTAVALLFALFELNPAPFCMLDEIDAPLDDANVSRFCELVKRMSARVQFIVITHNKLTMSLAEQLHGVTMAEPGVSRLVSVDIEQALDMAG